MHSCCSINVECTLSPVEQARTLTSLHPPLSLDNFHCPAIDSQVAITIFIKLFDNIYFFAHTYSSRHHTPPTTIHPQPTLLVIHSPVTPGPMCTAVMAV